MPSFYWLDYETWGKDPRADRPVQFAGQRTDWELNPIGEPLILYAQPSPDILPQPQACLITGITPQIAAQKGICEADFFKRIQSELAQPQTCMVGYNNIRFDDEITRFGFYRNFLDPYAHEWQHGNSRWDLIDVLRLAHALRPQGIEWPQDQGITRFKLEWLSQANGIEHGQAHDALADVNATIALARLLKQKQPRLFQYCFEHRLKSKLIQRVKIGQPIIHVSDKYPAELGCLAVVLPIAPHPQNQNSLIVYDLRQAPDWIDWDIERIQKGLFSPKETLSGERIALKELRLNHAPVVAPLSTLTPEARRRWRLDEAKEEQHLQKIKAHWSKIQPKIKAVFSSPPAFETLEAEQALYQGFWSRHDQKMRQQIQNTPPAQLAQFMGQFEDDQLNALFFRYRARNWPHYLSPAEQKQWQAYCQQKIQPLLTDYQNELKRLRQSIEPQKQFILDALSDWVLGF